MVDIYEGSGYDIEEEFEKMTFESVEDNIVSQNYRKRYSVWSHMVKCPDCGSADLFGYYNTFEDKFIIQCNAKPTKEKTPTKDAPLSICGWNIKL
jgi:hypothetical protein